MATAIEINRPCNRAGCHVHNGQTLLDELPISPKSNRSATAIGLARYVELSYDNLDSEREWLHTLGRISGTRQVLHDETLSNHRLTIFMMAEN